MSSATATYSAKARTARAGVTTPKTGSPTAKRDAPGPRASTVPAKSFPRTTGKRYSIIPFRYPAATAPSKPLTDDARTRTSTSPGPGLRDGQVVQRGGDPEVGEGDGAHGSSS